MTSYEGFSRQDLLDRRGALLAERRDLSKQLHKLLDEIDIIDALLGAPS